MKVILTMDVAEIGSRGDRVDVAAGYARNYLLPRRLAVPETDGALRVLQEESKLSDVRTAKAAQEAEKIASFLKEHEVVTTLKIGREGKAFGAVTSKDLAVLLRKEGLEVDRRRIVLDSPLRRLGVFEVPLSVHPDVETNIRVYVDAEGGNKDGALKHQAVWDAEAKAREEAEQAEAEARAERAREAEEAARIAIEKAAARKAREEEEAKARVEAEARAREAEGGSAVKGESEDGDGADRAEETPEKKAAAGEKQ
ncbi:50S ribosomal protein L9 [bacterium]|nr:50S ribosomal protein L9 [bacterium]